MTTQTRVTDALRLQILRALGNHRSPAWVARNLGIPARVADAVLRNAGYPDRSRVNAEADALEAANAAEHGEPDWLTDASLSPDPQVRAAAVHAQQAVTEYRGARIRAVQLVKLARWAASGESVYEPKKPSRKRAAK